MLCVHCSIHVQCNSGRGLCRSCWDDRAIRELYPPRRDTRPKKNRLPDTMEELDALVEQQYQNLPDWWDREQRRFLELGD